VAWLVAAVFSWLESREHIDTFFDTQQMLFAKRLAAAKYPPVTDHLPDTDDILAISGRGDEGEQEDDVLAFAVFTPDGRLLLNDGEDGKKIVFTPGANGFVNAYLEDDLWRIVWLTSLDEKVVVAVGQELEYRDDMALEMLTGQMLPWLFLLPVLLLGLTWMLSRELRPLRSVAANLSWRSPDDATPIETAVQSEVRPLVQALNSLFARIEAMLQRERVFISNAAHELRTPLAGLSIQAQVAQNARQPETRAHALSQLRKGISRASHLVEQLLMLFNLESLDPKHALNARNRQDADKSLLRWCDLLDVVVEEMREQIEARNIMLTLQDESHGAMILGQHELLSALLRNILGNAVKYSSKPGKIVIALDCGSLTVKNTCQEIDSAAAARLGERFYRPPGQIEPGSGLGLSIAKRIAQLHEFDMDVSVKSDWFSVVIVWPAATAA